MLKRLIDVPLDQPWTALVGLVVLVAAGLYSAFQLPLDAFPDLTNIQVVITSEADGLAPVEIEQLVTYPVESALMGLPGATEVRSLSKLGLSMVTVVFEDSVDLYFARRLVSERLAEARGALPEGVDPTLGPVATPFGEVYQYTVEGEGRSAMELKTLHDWEIRPMLRAISGVADVNTWGGFRQRYEVVVDPARLRSYGLTLRDVIGRVRDNNENFGAGFSDSASEQFVVRGVGRVNDIADIERIAVESQHGAPVLLRDVAEVRIGAVPRQGAVTRDGEGERVSGMVIMLKGENSKSVIDLVKQRIAEFSPSLPEGVSLSPFYDQSEVIDAVIGTVQHNLVLGAALVAVVLFFFLGDLRAAAIVASVIPLSMLAAFVGMEWLGVTANLMSLGAVDFGMIVDGAVVMVENAVRRVESEDPNEPVSIIERVRAGAHEVARPTAFGVGVIVAVYVPILALEGLEGRLYRPMAATVVSALIGALVLTLTVVPAACALLLRRRTKPHRTPILDGMRRAYSAILERILDRPILAIAPAALLVIPAFASLSWIGTEFMPRLDEGSILVQTFKLPSVSVPESVEMSLAVERTLRDFPEVTGVVTKLGRPDLATEAMGVYEGDVYVNLKPREQWTSASTKEGLIDALHAALEKTPGTAYSFTQPMAMRLDETLSGVRADVALKIFGEDAAELERLAERAMDLMRDVPGAADLQRDVFSGAAEWQVDIRRDKLASYGLRVSDVREVVEAAAGGVDASELIDGRRRFPVSVVLRDAGGESIEALSEVQITAPDGELVPLSRVADVHRASGPEAVQRENAQRRLVVQCNVRGRDLGGFIAEAQEVISENLSLPAGYYVDWGGQFENQQRAMARIMLIGPASLGVIFVILYAAFASVRLSALVLMVVPFAGVGGIAALWLRDLNLNVSALIGFIAVSGIAVLDGVVLISTVNRLVERGRPVREALMEGCLLRLRPVVMLGVVAALGFLPMATATSAGAEVQRPLATVVIGGLVTSTSLTLLVLPALFPHRRRRS